MIHRTHITGLELGYRVSEVAPDFVEAGHLLDDILEHFNTSAGGDKEQENDDFLYKISALQSGISDQYDQLEHRPEGKYGVAVFAIDGRGLSGCYRAIHKALDELESTLPGNPTPSWIWEHLPEAAQAKHISLFKEIIGGPIDDITIRAPHEWGSKLRAWIGNHSSECKYDPNDPLLQEKFAIAHTFYEAMLAATESYPRKTTEQKRKTQ